jgi:hypothetical protein
MRPRRRFPDSRTLPMQFQRAISFLWRRCLALLPASKRYRPELHYMRGPGPKYLKRHSSSAGDRELRT